jgi:hypothetical protein
VQQAIGHVVDILYAFACWENVTLLVVVRAGASLVRIAIAYANRSVLLNLKERAV